MGRTGKLEHSVIASGESGIAATQHWLARFTLVVIVLVGAAPALAQSLTTGALDGLVTDPASAVVPDARVTVTDIEQDLSHMVLTQADGRFLIPLLPAGRYMIVVDKSGFQKVEQLGVVVSVTVTTTVNFKLGLASVSQQVVVTDETPQLQPENANTTTTLDAKTIESMPIPGNDLSSFVQMAPGYAITSNPTVNGIPNNNIQGAGVQYTLDGIDFNDPYTNGTIAGSSGSVLGSNAIQQVSIDTVSLGVDQGRMAGANINFVSKSGSKDFHGNARWQWNGSALNAYDYFLKSNPGTVPSKPFSDVNAWAGALSGPIIKSKLFFFVDSEGVRSVSPYVSTFNVPSPALIQYASQQLLLGGYDTSISFGTGTTTYRPLPPEPQEAQYQQKFLSLFGDTAVGTVGARNTSASTVAVLGCNITAAGTVDPTYNPQKSPSTTNPVPSDTGCENSVTASKSLPVDETLTIVRLDYHLNANNLVWLKFSGDQGTVILDPGVVNSAFERTEPQPSYQSALDWTHTLTSNLTNEAATGFFWTKTITNFANPSAEKAAVGLEELDSPFAQLGAFNAVNGHALTDYKFIDNVAWQRGAHFFRFGTNFLRTLVNDYGIGLYSGGRETLSNFSEILYGAASAITTTFPIIGNGAGHFREFDLEGYAGDTWKLPHNLTLSYGLHAAHDSNLSSPIAGFANWADFNTFPHPNLGGGNLATPPNAQFAAASQLWNSVPNLLWQPRVALAWQPHHGTLFKAGWGLFSTVDATRNTDQLDRNPPFDPKFVGGYGKGDLGAVGSVAGCTITGGSNAECGYLMDPSQPNSVLAATAAANQLLQANFSSGQPSCVVGNSLNCVPQSAVTAMPKDGVKALNTYQYDVSVQQELGKQVAFSIAYVGTQTKNTPYTIVENSFQSVCPGCYSPYFYATSSAGAPDPRFSSYTQWRYDGYVNYNALQTGLILRNYHGLNVDFKFAWSHCMNTLTPYSDQGINTLRSVYVDCAQDVTDNAKAFYSYRLPFNSKQHLLGILENGWMISGITFSQGGTPLFTTFGAGSFITGTGAPLGGVVSPTLNPYSKRQSISGITPTGAVQWLNPSALLAGFDSATGKCINLQTGVEDVVNNTVDCQFVGNSSTGLRGPRFQWTNFELAKTTKVFERLEATLDVQAYNFFNHANFANPTATAAGNTKLTSGLGAITSDVSLPNSFLPSGGSGARVITTEIKVSF